MVSPLQPGQHTIVVHDELGGLGAAEAIVQITVVPGRWTLDQRPPLHTNHSAALAALIGTGSAVEPEHVVLGLRELLEALPAVRCRGAPDR